MWFDSAFDVPVRFWVCPVLEHRGRTDEHGRPVQTVEWVDGIAHCTAPDCDQTSAPPPEDT